MSMKTIALALAAAVLGSTLLAAPAQALTWGRTVTYSRVQCGTIRCTQTKEIATYDDSGLTVITKIRHAPVESRSILRTELALAWSHWEIIGVAP
jgi:hypothetical protein